MDLARAIQEAWPKTHWRKIGLRLDLPEAIHLGTFERSRDKRAPIRAIATVDLMDRWNAGAWLHLSVSRPNRLPTWGDLVVAREELGYGARVFVQLLPPVTHWLNVGGFVLHLFHRIDGDTVPQPLWDQEGCDGSTYRKPGSLDGKGQIK